MKRISLNERLGEKPNRDVVSLYAGLTVFEYFRGTRRDKPEKIAPSTICRFIRQLKNAGIDMHLAMCHTVMRIVMSNSDSAEEILYELLVDPIYRIQKEKEERRHEHSLCTEGDSDGPDPDDDGGRSVPTP